MKYTVEGLGRHADFGVVEVDAENPTRAIEKALNGTVKVRVLTMKETCELLESHNIPSSSLNAKTEKCKYYEYNAQAEEIVSKIRDFRVRYINKEVYFTEETNEHILELLDKEFKIGNCFYIEGKDVKGFYIAKGVENTKVIFVGIDGEYSLDFTELPQGIVIKRVMRNSLVLKN